MVLGGCDDDGRGGTALSVSLVGADDKSLLELLRSISALIFPSLLFVRLYVDMESWAAGH